MVSKIKRIMERLGATKASRLFKLLLEKGGLHPKNGDTPENRLRKNWGQERAALFILDLGLFYP